MILVAALAAMALGGCALKAPAPEPAPLVAQVAAEPPVISWRNPGDDVYIYHNIKGDCAYLTHGHGRNNAWGLWRLPLAAITTGEIVDDEYAGLTIRYACKDGSDCIESGELDETPFRIADHAIPFQTAERAQEWLSEVSQLTAACTAAH